MNNEDSFAVEECFYVTVDSEAQVQFIAIYFLEIKKGDEGGCGNRWSFPSPENYGFQLRRLRNEEREITYQLQTLWG